MIRGIQKWDALPADDLGLRKTTARYYCSDIRIPSDETCRIAKMGKMERTCGIPPDSG
jgi:3-methyladenine DNA glycosylase/8-oxoguanine DNA glycosylase